MRFLCTLIVVVVLHVIFVKSRCTGCKNTFFLLFTKAACCRHITNGNFYECTGWTKEVPKDPATTDCNDWFPPVDSDGRSITKDHPYPPYFERQPEGTTQCVYSVYHNVLAFAGIDPNTLTDANIIEIGDALVSFWFNDQKSELGQYVKADGDAAVGHINSQLFRYIMPLNGLKITPDGTNGGDRFAYYDGWYNTLFGGTDRNKIWSQSGGNDMNADDIKALINDARFIGIVFEAQSSHEGWVHETTILKDPRGPLSRPRFWYLDPGFPILTLPFTTQSWTRKRTILADLTDSSGLARVGVDGTGVCTMPAVCDGTSPFHNGEFDMMHADNDWTPTSR